jgi:hypothetical protein
LGVDRGTAVTDELERFVDAKARAIEARLTEAKG